MIWDNLLRRLIEKSIKTENNINFILIFHYSDLVCNLICDQVLSRKKVADLVSDFFSAQNLVIDLVVKQVVDRGVTMGWLLRLATGTPLVGGPQWTKREKA